MTADAEFLLSKAKYRAATGREQRRDADVLCYQIRQSFKPGEITPEAVSYTHLQSNKGKGRFSYLSFSHSAEWHTVYRADSKLKQYTISTNSASRSQFDTTEPVDVIDETETGTTVTFSLEDSNTADLLSFGAMKQKLLEEFAWYLFLNKDKGYVLEYTGISLDISE